MTPAAWNAVVVPSSPLMIAPFGATDPLGQVRELAVDAVRWLVAAHPDRVLVLTAPADPANVARGVPTPLGQRVAEALLSAAGFGGAVELATSPVERVPGGAGVLVVGDGSARRGEKAPGHLDERAFDFDESVEKALLSCSTADLQALSPSSGADLLAAGVLPFRALGALPGAGDHTATLDHSDDPLGVKYWIVRWQCAS